MKFANCVDYCKIIRLLFLENLRNVPYHYCSRLQLLYCGLSIVMMTCDVQKIFHLFFKFKFAIFIYLFRMSVWKMKIPRKSLRRKMSFALVPSGTENITTQNKNSNTNYYIQITPRQPCIRQESSMYIIMILINNNFQIPVLIDLYMH